MLDRMYNRLAGRSGFTLVELLVVLIVISVLLGFTTVRVTSAIDSARVAGEKAQVRNAFMIAQSNYADRDQDYDGGEVVADIQGVGGDYAGAGTTEYTAADAIDNTDLTAGQITVLVDATKAAALDASAPAGSGDYLLVLLDSEQNGEIYCYEDNVGTISSGEMSAGFDDVVVNDAPDGVVTCA